MPTHGWHPVNVDSDDDNDNYKGEKDWTGIREDNRCSLFQAVIFP